MWQILEIGKILVSIFRISSTLLRGLKFRIEARIVAAFSLVHFLDWLFWLFLDNAVDFVEQILTKNEE